MPIVSRRGRFSGRIATKARFPHQANKRPSAPPAIEKTALSVNICLMMRPRPPPSAARTAISRSLDAARTSNRLATLAHAMSNTNPAAAKTAMRSGRTCATMSSCIEFTVICIPDVAWYWYCSRNVVANLSISA